MPPKAHQLTVERRTLVLPIEYRAKNDGQGSSSIAGYAARYFDASDPNTQYQLWDDCYERIMPGAFASALARPDDVRCLFNHDPNNILGRTTSGTCQLKADDKGLYFQCDMPDSPIGQTVATAIDRKDVTGCSFSFDVLSANWLEEANDGNEIWYRQIVDVQLYDVGPVTFPAYTATDIASVRSSLDKFRAERTIPNSVRNRRRRWRFMHR